MSETTTDSKAKSISRLAVSINGNEEIEIQLVTDDNRGTTIWYRLSAKQTRALHAILDAIFAE